MKRFLAALLALCLPVQAAIFNNSFTTNATGRTPNVLPTSTNVIYPLMVLNPDGSGVDRQILYSQYLTLTGTNTTLGGNLSLNGRTNRLSISGGQLLLDGAAITGGGGDTVWTNDANIVSIIGTNNLIKFVNTPQVPGLSISTSVPGEAEAAIAAASGAQSIMSVQNYVPDFSQGGQIDLLATKTSATLTIYKTNADVAITATSGGYITLGGTTNQISDNGTALIRNGVAIVGDTTATNIVTLTQTSTNVSQLDFSLVQNGGVFKLQATNHCYIGAPANVANTSFKKAWLVFQQPSTGGCFLTFSNAFWAMPDGQLLIPDTNNGACVWYEMVTCPISNGLVHLFMSQKSKLP